MTHPAQSRSPASQGADGARTDNEHFQFQFKPRHRNVPDDLILVDLNRVAQSLGVNSISVAVYRGHGGTYGTLMIQRRFKGWNAALIQAGLIPGHLYRVPRQSIVDDIRRVARKLNTNCLLETHYLEHSQYSTSLIYRHFGSWHRAVQIAGLKPSRHRKATITELFENLEEIWRTLKRQPRQQEMFPPLSQFSVTPYMTNFGTFQGALRAFVKFKSANHPRPATVPLRPKPKPTHKTKRSINHRLRYKVLKRDHFKCQSCGQSPATHPGVSLQVDHIHPWSRGGETIESNLRALCKHCNSGKSNLV